jgi:hypothetical protein
MILLVETTTKMIEKMIGVPAVVIKGRSKGRRRGGGRDNPDGGRKRGRFQGGAGRKDPGVDELDTIEVFCSNLISFRIYLTTNTGKQYKWLANVVYSCSTSNMVNMTPQSWPRSFARLLQLWRKQNL